MKNIFLFLILFVSSSHCFSNIRIDEGEWNEKDMIYTNYTYGFYWRLDNEMSWVSQPLMQKDAIFGAVDMETNTVAYITASPMETDCSDIWLYESEIRKGQKEAYDESNGVNIIEMNKVVFAGKNALKTKLIYNLNNDDRFKDVRTQMIVVQYTVLLQGYGVTFSIMASQVLEESLNQYGLSIENVLFNGVVLTKPEQLK